MFVCAFFETIFMFTGTLAMNRLLAHLENPAASTLTPYVWVVMILVVPVLMSVALQHYFICSIELTATAKAALVQALYEKTLRVRIAGASEDKDDLSAGPGERNRVGRINNLMSSDMYYPWQ
jgi:hypothetical protein